MHITVYFVRYVSSSSCSVAAPGVKSDVLVSVTALLAVEEVCWRYGVLFNSSFCLLIYRNP